MSIKTGPRSTGTVVNDASFGVVAWSNPSNALTSDDNRATAALTAANATTNYLVATNFGFAIPSDARIDGFVFEVERSESASVVIDTRAFAIKGGVIPATNGKPRAEEWATTDEIVSYGSPTDLWGEGWTPDDINDSGFGFAFAARRTFGTPTARIDHIRCTVWYTRASDRVRATVKLRAPFPPHEEILTLDGATDISFGKSLNRMNTARFLLSRADVNLNAFGHLLHPDGPPPMYTIERSDGLHPFVGFLTDYDADQDDPFCEFILSDHLWRLSHGTTRKSGRIKSSAGQLVADTLAEIDAAGEPAHFIELSGIVGGPEVEWNYQLDSGLAFLQGVAEASGWEYGLEHIVSSESVRTRLLFQEFIGVDRRHAVVIEEGGQLQKANYHIDYSKGIKSGIAVGGTGSMADRNAESAATRSRDGINTNAPKRLEQLGIGGTRTVFVQQVTNPAALKQAAQRLHDAPEYAAETLQYDLIEDNVDMREFNVGDIVSVRLITTDLGMPLERPVRTLAIDYNPQTRIHRITPQVLR